MPNKERATHTHTLLSFKAVSTVMQELVTH